MTLPFDSDWDRLCMPRLGVAAITRMAFEGRDLFPLWTEMMDKVTDDAPGSGLGMDLSVIAQLRGDKETGLAIQRDSLLLHQTFRVADIPQKPALRVLALAAASDLGANTPVDFLLAGSDVSLATLYLGPEVPLPAAIPDHDVAIVLAPASEEKTLAAIENLTRCWNTPLLNPPARIRGLERDLLYRNLSGVEGLVIPPTLRVERTSLSQGLPSDLGLCFPIIIRPFGSHAGFGLSKIESPEALGAYLKERPEDGFFISPFIDYASADGHFRKYRVALIGGTPYPVHMAVCEEWKVWYLNADMALSATNRAEEARFLLAFDQTFGTRYSQTLAEVAQRIGLDYVLIDCAETRDGKLLVFEADHCAIVHDMDPVNVYPYKPGAMGKIFGAFATMLKSKAQRARVEAA
jgi:glutathione synthase/RimK-type ligase-like ATP-grasp enzyme